MRSAGHDHTMSYWLKSQARMRNYGTAQFHDFDQVTVNSAAAEIPEELWEWK